MYRLIATDIDDTILAPDGSLPDANRIALEHLHELGVVVVLSSGRATVSMRELSRKIVPMADDEYLISFNGARVTTLESDTVIHEKILSPDAVTRVMEYARPRGLLVLGYRESDFIVERDDKWIVDYASDTGMSYEVVPSLEQTIPDGSPKLLIIDAVDTVAEHRQGLSAVAENLYVVSPSKPRYLEIISPGVSKGDALLRLAAHLGIPAKETLAVGDSMNDMEMLAAAGLGVAVANARTELKAVADVVLNRTAAEGALEEVAQRFWGT